MANDGVSISLTNAQALVLFEWLKQMEEARTLPLKDSAEEEVLWRIEARLESALVEPFESDYKELLAKTREQVLAGER